MKPQFGLLVLILIGNAATIRPAEQKTPHGIGLTLQQMASFVRSGDHRVGHNGGLTERHAASIDDATVDPPRRY